MPGDTFPSLISHRAKIGKGRIFGRSLHCTTKSKSRRRGCQKRLSEVEKAVRKYKKTE